MCVSVHVCVHVFVYVDVCVCVCGYVCVCVCACVCGWVDGWARVFVKLRIIHFAYDFCPQDNFYSMPCAYLGNCVIVNNVKEEMPETVQEVADLQKACETIGFDVTVYTDQSLEVHSFHTFSFRVTLNVD